VEALFVLKIVSFQYIHRNERSAFEPFKDEAQTALFKNPVRTAQ
jgi:hypothetical protein